MQARESNHAISGAYPVKADEGKASWRKIIAAGFGVLGLAGAPFAATPANPNASVEAREVLNYIYSIYGKQMMTAQMDAPFGGKETEYVFSTTGKYEAIIGIDLINENQNNGEVTKAIDYWKAGGLVTVMWHWGAPTVGEGYDASKSTVSNFNNLFVEGSNENKEMMSDLDRIAGHLAKLRDAHVPVIFRPMHECSGGWFWWDKSGGAGFVKLWKFMFDYFTKTKKLDNLLWFLGYDGSPSVDYNPGAGYFDMVGADTYGPGGPYAAQYTGTQKIHGSEIPIALHECGVAPVPETNLAQKCMFAWFMVWHTTYIHNMNTTLLKSIYTSPLAVTRDKLPKDWSQYAATPILRVSRNSHSGLTLVSDPQGFAFTTDLPGVNRVGIFSTDGRAQDWIPFRRGPGNTYSVALPLQSRGMRILKVQGAGKSQELPVLLGR